MGCIQEITRENNRLVRSFLGAGGKVDESRPTDSAYDDDAFLSHGELLADGKNDIIEQAVLGQPHPSRNAVYRGPDRDTNRQEMGLTDFEKPARLFPRRADAVHGMSPSVNMTCVNIAPLPCGDKRSLRTLCMRDAYA
jgi:hypothetical protein